MLKAKLLRSHYIRHKYLPAKFAKFLRIALRKTHNFVEHLRAAVPVTVGQGVGIPFFYFLFCFCAIVNYSFMTGA